VSHAAYAPVAVQRTPRPPATKAQTTVADNVRRDACDDLCWATVVRGLVYGGDALMGVPEHAMAFSLDVFGVGLVRVGLDFRSSRGTPPAAERADRSS
jgi:hypothetical protein